MVMERDGGMWWLFYIGGLGKTPPSECVTGQTCVPKGLSHVHPREKVSLEDRKCQSSKAGVCLKCSGTTTGSKRENQEKEG